MTMLRINFSHTNSGDAGKLVQAVRALNKMRGRDVRLLQDLRGGKMSVKRIQGHEVVVGEGMPVRFCAPKALDTYHEFQGAVVEVDLDQPFMDLQTARHLVGKDASLLFDITHNRAAAEGWIDTVTVRGGVLRPEKGLNAPGMKRAVGLTEKDREDLLVGLDLGVDAVCLSFVSEASEVEEAISLMEDGGARPEVYAKIECAEGVANASSILDAVDGIIIGRGDLSAETSWYEIAQAQSELTRLAVKKGRPCIVATGVLTSLQHDARPSPAELRDIHLSLLEGVTGFMLTSETNIGRNPALAVQVLVEASKVAAAAREHLL